MKSPRAHQRPVSIEKAIRYAEYLLEQQGPQGYTEGAEVIARDVKERLSNMRREQRLRVFALLMQCPGGGGGLTSSERKTLQNTVRGILYSSDPVPSCDEMRAAVLATYYGGVEFEDEEGLLTRARQITQEEDDPTSPDGRNLSRAESRGGASETTIRFAHIFICCRARNRKELHEHIQALLETKDEFGITHGVQGAASRLNDRWTGIHWLECALKKVRNPIHRAKLFTEKVRLYTKILMDHRETYDPAVDTGEQDIVRAMHVCKKNVFKTPKCFRLKARCLVYLGKLAIAECQFQKARGYLTQAVDYGETYGSKDIAKLATREMENIPVV